MYCFLFDCFKFASLAQALQRKHTYTLSFPLCSHRSAHHQTLAAGGPVRRQAWRGEPRSPRALLRWQVVQWLRHPPSWQRRPHKSRAASGRLSDKPGRKGHLSEGHGRRLHHDLVKFDVLAKENVAWDGWGGRGRVGVRGEVGDVRSGQPEVRWVWTVGPYSVLNVPGEMMPSLVTFAQDETRVDETGAAEGVL